MERNFVIKLLFWLDSASGGVMERWNFKGSMKLAAENIVKEQEYLFCYLLTRLGIDVLLLQYASDIDQRLDASGFSSVFRLGEFQKISVKIYNAQACCQSTAVGSPERKVGRRLQAFSENVGAARPSAGREVFIDGNDGKTDNGTPASAGSSEKQEKGFEELALLASSVVMIPVHGPDREIVATGSGIMIGKDGYILTNHHVAAAGGQVYSVRIENDDQVYLTDEIIKYNPAFDLAVIRIDRTLRPLSLYDGAKPLARGQKVVAIGSPLGMFNSVSDGIISGFRKFDTVDMIQFTAPVSHGSSGGALLNMYGEVIGIITAGIDQGQNINLAAGYESIGMFTNGFR